jgi:hypothetical protein
LELSILPYQPKRTSDFLVNLVHARQSENLAIGEIIKLAGSRAYGFLLIIFGLPNILPIPGLPVLCGLILFFVGIQLVLRNPVVWMPAMVTEREISTQKLAQVIKKAFPLIEKIEKFARPRLDIMVRDEIVRIIGIIVTALAFSLIIVPIPFVGSMPQGIAIVLLGLGLIERDGVIIAFGFVFSAIATAVITGIGFAIVKGWGILF